MDKITERNIADALMERPYRFTLLERQFALHPMTLGKHLLAERLIDRLGIDEANIRTNALLEAVRIAKANPRIVCRLIALACSDSKEMALNDDRQDELTDFFGKNMSQDSMSTLLIWVLTSDKYSEFIKESGLEQEIKYMRRAQNAKESKNTYTFGGKTMYGMLIDRAAERYGWTLDYIVWGISYINLRMLLADSVTSIYLSDDERKKAHIPNDRTFISADDPKNIERIMKLCNA